MSVIDATHAATEQMVYASSPFAAATVLGETSQLSEVETGRSPVGLSSPFAEALESPEAEQYGAEAEAFELLQAEFEDEDFVEAVSALTDEAAAEHLRAAARWGEGAQAASMAAGEVEQWLAGTVERADHLLAELEGHFGDRQAEGELEAEIARVTGPLTATLAEGPLDARELFLGKLVKKAVAVAKGVGKAVAKGVRAVGKLLPLGRLFAVLRRLVRPLLQRVLQKAIGKLPPQLQPLARTLAGKLGFGPRPARAASSATSTPAAPGGSDAAPTPAGASGASAAEPAADAAPDASGVSAEALVDELDARLAEAVLAGEGAGAEAWLGELESEVDQAGRAAGEGPFGELDAARDRLARQLLAGDPQAPPLAELEQFIPAVMAAMPLIRLGVKIIGRNRVVSPLAKLLGTLIQPMVGQAAAGQLSRPLASAGLALLGLEAEAGAGDGRLGAEALVATVEDTVRELLELPAESLETELLLESEVQEAFTRAALRHFPARVLRPGLGDDRGVWVLFPRVGTRRRYKRYSIVEPVSITPPLARSIFLDGETLEDRLLEAGVTAWPVHAEVHHYETLPGATLGHLAAFETPTVPAAEGALEFEDLEAFRPLLAAAPPRDHRPGAGGPGAGRPGPHRPGQRAPERGRDLPPGSRLVRLAVPGLRLRRRSPLRVRLDVAGPAPVLRLSLHLGEQVAHELVRDLENRRAAQVVARFRTIAGDPLRRVLADRLARKLARHAMVLPDGGRERLAGNLAEAALRAVAKELPGLAPTLSAAAQAEAPGVTVTFGFRFADRAALIAGTAPEPQIAVHPGGHRG